MLWCAYWMVSEHCFHCQSGTNTAVEFLQKHGLLAKADRKWLMSERAAAAGRAHCAGGNIHPHGHPHGR
jgi:hypothetical protein